MPEPIHLSGTTLEGGGQLVRICICLGVLTSTPIYITSIRGNRSGGGGLKSQHLTSIQWLAHASNAHVKGMGLKSKQLTFTPSPSATNAWETETGGDITIKQSTPGSVTLVLQAILPYILFTTTTPIRIRLTGGTNVSNSPSVDYIEQVLIPILSLIGVPPITSKIHARGWSQGGTSLGGVTYTVNPFPPSPSPGSPKLPTFNLTERGDIVSVHATIIAPSSYEHPLTKHLNTVLTSASVLCDLSPTALKTIPEIQTTTSFTPSHHPKRIYLLLVATTSTGIKLGHDWLYDRRIDVTSPIDSIVESLVAKVVQGLLREVRHGGCVDEWMRDQIVVFQALAGGVCGVHGGRRRRKKENGDEEEGTLEPSLHARTAMWVAEQILGVKFDAENGTCVGVGFAGDARMREEEETDHIDVVGTLTQDMARVEL
ncbi:RNA 3'-terminal phosphate cyclase [Periconia macrospinosa]|uniref:RNA 3'-terminal phosphate cyclase n=1 Tax=Periconia macrospinosa TaxID=97972 RepID=A0A2V1DBF2_9PLEO|nr:RNA 3'-terminal phosphate cyclase [Periconia macrospinosa]